VSASRDKTLKLWDVGTGEALRTFRGHTFDVWGAAFSPDGTRLVSSSAIDITLWDVATGEALHTFSGHPDWVQSVAFSPDGARVVSASRDETLKLWDVNPE
jgi:WD40 repeat protein